MKIYDCFMYFDEDLVLDVRLNTLNEFVDYFIIVESKFTHNGQKRNLNFKIENYNKFKDKILYFVYDKVPNNIETINQDDSSHKKNTKYIINAAKRENSQRNHIIEGLKNANDDDLILVSDVDEIPNLRNIKLNSIKEKIIMFRQQMFYYKFNLKIPNLVWTGTKGCKKKKFLNPQWLRNIKDKKYSIFRPDIIFSKKKYNNIKFIENGGWHFTNIKKAEEIKHKFESYLHHREFDLNPLSTKQIEEIIKNKKAIYNLNVDKRLNKFEGGVDLEKIEIKDLPSYINENIDKYEEWLD